MGTVHVSAVQAATAEYANSCHQWSVARLMRTPQETARLSPENVLVRWLRHRRRLQVSLWQLQDHTILLTGLSEVALAGAQGRLRKSGRCIATGCDVQTVSQVFSGSCAVIALSVALQTRQ